MMTVGPLVLVVLVIVCAVAASFVLQDGEVEVFFICLFAAVILAALLAFSPIWNPSGLPLGDIDSGTYKVGFVYLAGENVNVAVELPLGQKVITESIYYYQFKKDAFEGTLNTNAKKLVVVQAGNFKKLRLE